MWPDDNRNQFTNLNTASDSIKIITINIHGILNSEFFLYPAHEKL